MGELLIKLYIAGETARSLNAVRNLRRIVDDYLGGQVETVIVDILEHPRVARAEKLLAIPTLVKERPLPTRRVVGDLSDIPAVLGCLDIDSYEREEEV